MTIEDGITLTNTIWNSIIDPLTKESPELEGLASHKIRQKLITFPCMHESIMRFQ